MSFRNVVCCSSTSGKVTVSPVKHWHCDDMPMSSAVCTGWGSERFELKRLAHLIELKEATVRCLIVNNAPMYQRALHVTQAGCGC